MEFAEVVRRQIQVMINSKQTVYNQTKGDKRRGEGRWLHSKHTHITKYNLMLKNMQDIIGQGGTANESTTVTSSFTASEAMYAQGNRQKGRQVKS